MIAYYRKHGNVTVPAGGRQTDVAVIDQT